MSHESICLPTASVSRKKAVSNAELAKKLDALEQTIDGQFEIVFEAIAHLLHARVPRRNQIGYRAKFRKKRKEPKDKAA